jgi:hypothetical protein
MDHSGMGDLSVDGKSPFCPRRAPNFSGVCPFLRTFVTGNSEVTPAERFVAEKSNRRCHSPIRLAERCSASAQGDITRQLRQLAQARLFRLATLSVRMTRSDEGERSGVSPAMAQ